MQFDVFKNPDPRTKATYPFLVCFQSDLLDSLTTMVVAPLVPQKRSNQAAVITRLHPTVEIDGKQFSVIVSPMSAIDRRILGSVVASLADQRSALVGAYDFVISGV